jgi:hypothetical protein
VNTQELITTITLTEKALDNHNIDLGKRYLHILKSALLAEVEAV